MKKILLILLSFLFALSCKKECMEPIDKGLFKGKLKTLVDDRYSSGLSNNNTIPKFYFYYDSTNGSLKNIAITIDSIVTQPYLQIHKQGSNIYITSRLLQKNIRVVTNGKQITAIWLKDTINNTEQEITHIAFKNGKVDSVFDVGAAPPLAGSILFSDFQYNINGCANYTASWTDFYTGTIGYHQHTYSLTYSNLLNNNLLNYQMPCALFNNPDIGTELNFIVFILGLDGYYLMHPNEYLIDSVVITDSSYPTIRTKYDYITSGGNVSRVVLINKVDTSTFTYHQDYTYY